MAKTYTVQDSATGKNITFQWGGAKPPTEEDMAHVVTQSGAAAPEPEGYLPVTADGPIERPSAAELMDKSERKWTPQDLKEAIHETNVPEWGRNNPNLYGAFGAAKALGRTGIETAGQVAGGALGALSPLPGGALLGAGTGYAAAKQLADFALGDDEWKPPTFGDVAKDATLGAVTQGAGMLLPKIPGAYRSVRDFAKGVAPALTENAIKERAAGIIASKMGTAPEYEANAAKAAAVMEDIPGFRASIAEMRNDPGLIKLQRGYEAGDTPAAHALIEKNAANRQALDSYLESTFGADKGIDSTLEALTATKNSIDTELKWAAGRAGKAQNAINPVDRQTAGQQLNESVARAMEPVLKQERELWAKVPNYPLPATNTEGAFREILSTPSTAEGVVKTIADIYERTPKTVQGLQTVEREINSAIENGTQTEKHFLRQLKSAINEDFAAMGEAADAGNVAVHEGRIVYPQRLKAEQANLTARIAQEQSAAETTPDIGAIRTALKEAGTPPNEWMRQVNETPQQYNGRLITKYHQKIGTELPMLSAQEPATIAPLRDRIAQIDTILADAQPADNVAKAYREAKDFSRTQKFDRFDKGAIREILKPGNSANSRAVSDSQVIGRFFSGTKAVDEADQLIKALGGEDLEAGKKAAARVMEGHIAQDLLDYAQTSTKELNPQRLATWLQKRGAVLDKYGLRSQYENLNAAHETLEAAKEAQSAFSRSIAAKMLNADPQKAISAAMQGNGEISAKNTSGIMQDLMRQVQGNPQAVEGLRAGFKDFIIDLAETTRKTMRGDNMISPASVQKTLAKYEPAMKVLYKDAPEQYRAMRNVSKALEIQSRSASSPLGGSDTTEKGFVNLMRLIEHAPLVGGPVGAVAKLTKLGLGAFKSMNQKQVDEMVVRMLYDPEFAQTFAMAAKGQSPKEVERRMAGHLKALRDAAIGAGLNQAGGVLPDPLGIRGDR